MKRITKPLLISLFVVLLASAGAVAFWSARTYRPSEIALQAVESDNRVAVKMENGFISFRSAGSELGNELTGLIFYPGGGVDYRAYAPVLRMIAERGYFVALVSVPLNLAFFEVNAADDVIPAHPEVARWVVGGHSLGGVAASRYAVDNPQAVDGVVFWASYPADNSLKRLGIPVLSVYGSNDGLSTLEMIEESRALLPPDALFVPVEGGNHAQFGAYGEQSGDAVASISAEEQWRQVAEATVQFLEGLQGK